jgi:hypothetical protein
VIVVMVMRDILADEDDLRPDGTISNFDETNTKEKNRKEK